MKVWRVILVALVIFVAGAVGGAAAARLFQSRPANPRAAGPPWAAQRSEMLRLMQRELDLSHDQREQARHLFEESRERMNKEWRRESQQVREELGRILTPEQRRRWQEIQRNRAGRRQESPQREEWKHPENRKFRNQPGQQPDNTPSRPPGQPASTNGADR